MTRKLFSGPKLRRFREQRGETQAAFAQALGVSTSYLNQIENNQRPLTATVLLKLNKCFQADLQAFSDDNEDRLAAELQEALADPLFQGERPSLRELRDVVAVSPGLVGQLLTLYRAFRESADNYRELAERASDDHRIGALEGAQFPYEEVRDYFYIRNNYVGELDQAAEQLQAEQQFNGGHSEASLADYLKSRHGVAYRLLEESGQGGVAMRRYDRDSRSLYLSSRQPPARRAFHLAYQIGLLEHRELMDQLVQEAHFASREAANVCRVGLANYFAGALLMPYTLFLSESKRQRFDLESLELFFGVTFESVCHRLSTLQRPGAKGIPFYFLRVDMAGNISKRQSASSFHFARSGGACPLWNVHEAFSAPGKILTQVAEMPDGKRYFCLARTVVKAGGGYLNPQRRFAIGLGCAIEYADQLIYSTGVDLNDPKAAVPIGPSCRTCERQGCAQRAFPPIGKRLVVSDERRGFDPYEWISVN